MIITMHSGILHYADNVVIVAGETIKFALESVHTEGIGNLLLLRTK